jgi:enoyl-CoA hydratase/carnithine racemase
MIELETRDAVKVLHLSEGENRFNRSTIDGINAALDEVVASTGAVALVTVGEGKFFSNGLDLDWMGGDGGADSEFLADVHAMLLRVLRLDMVTVAAINGHAFAGGAMLAAAHDYRVMREDRGYWCLPEVDLGLPLTPVMFEVLDAHIPRATLADAALTGRRYSGPEALAAGIVTATASESEVLDRAVETAAVLAEKDRRVIAAHKALLYGE